MDTRTNLRNLKLPAQLMFNGADLAPELLEFVDHTVMIWTGAGHLSVKDGYGLASTNVLPVNSLMNVDWDDPQALLGFGVAAHGAEKRYAMNAIRKMRMLTRALQAGYFTASSLEVATALHTFPREVITDDEEAAEKAGGPVRWGDFPYGGAVYASDGRFEVMLGCSIW